MDSAKKKLSQFVKEQGRVAGKGGVKCKTCALKQADEINEMIREIDKLKRSGKEGSSIPWGSLFDHMIINEPSFHYPMKRQALLKHTRQCLGIEIS